MKPEVSVVVVRNLLASTRTEHQASARLCLTELLETFAPDLAEVAWLARIRIGDRLVEPEHWDHVRPKPGATVLISIAEPRGTGPLSTGSLFGDIALGVLFFPYGVTLLATAGLGLLAPEAPTSPTQGQQSYTLTGTRNEMAQVGQVIPWLGGRWRKVFPLHCAQPYAAWEGSTQYLHALLTPGWGPVQISALKVGDIPFASFEGLTYETREGRDTDTAVTLYPRVVHEALAEPNGQPIKVTHADGPFTAQIDDPDVTRLEFELTWPQGLYRFGDSGKRHPLSVEVKIEYRALPGGSYTTLAQTVVTKETQNSYRQMWATNVSANAAGWEGKVTRLSNDYTESRQQADTYWTSFRGRTQDAPIHQPGMALIAIKVPASQHAQGMLDQISCDCTRYALDWNGSAWVEAPTANPAANYRAVAQHVRANRGEVFADSDIDLAALQGWRTRSFNAGRTFGLIFADEGSMLDRLRAIAKSARADYSTVDGKLSVIEDIERISYVQAITPHNSTGFTKTTSFRRRPHALRVSFFDNTQEMTRQEITVYADGRNSANATIFDDLDLTRYGITNPTRAWEEGRMVLAESLYRRWEASQDMGIEALTARRGDLVSFMHPAALLGIASGRIKAVAISGSNTTSITLQSPVLMEVGTSYAVRVRSIAADGSPQLTEIAVNTIAGRQTTLSFTSPVPTATAAIAAGDMYQYGEVSRVAEDCIVKSIAPSGPRRVSVIVWPHAQPAINDSFSGPMDPYDPKVTAPQGQPKPPAKPAIVAIRRGDLTLPGDPYPVRMIQLTAVLAQPPAKATPANFFDAQFRQQGLGDWTAAAASMAGLEVSFLVPWGFNYEVEVRAGSTSAGIPITSAWSDPITVDCSTVPDTIVDLVRVSGLELFGQAENHNFTGKDAHLVWRMTSWTGPAEIGEEEGGGDSTFLDPTFSHWRVAIYSGDDLSELRREERVTAPDYVYSYEKNWSDAKLLAPDNPITAIARQLTVLVWVVDRYGRQSPSPARVTVQNPAPPLPSGLSVSTNVGTIWVSFDQPNDPDWIGMKVWATQSATFTPDDATNLLGKVNANIASFNDFQATGAPVLPGTTYYVVVAAFDAFGDDPVLLNISGSFLAETQSIDLAALPQFTFDPAPNYSVALGVGTGGADRLTWTGATAHVTHPDTNQTTTYTIGGGTLDWPGATQYLSYQEGDTALEVSSDPAHHTTQDRTLMAVWRGAQQVTSYNGQAQIDGSFIYGQTITANAIATGVAVITQGAQIASAIINNAHIVDLDVNKLLAGSIFTKYLYVGKGTGGRVEIRGDLGPLGAIAPMISVYDDQSTPIERVRIGKLGAAATAWGMSVKDNAGLEIFNADALDGSYIKNLTVGTLKIADGAVTQSVLVTGGSLNISDGSEQDFLSAVITSTAGKRTLIQLAANCNNANNGTIRILRNGVSQKTFATGTFAFNFTFSGAWVDNNPPAGSVTYLVRYQPTGSAANGILNGGVLWVQQVLK